MESKATRRLQTIHNHITSAADDPPPLVQPNQTAGEFFNEQGYSVVLPEKLKTGKWNVYRSAASLLKLITTFPDHPEIGTLHASETFSDYKYLGTRIRPDGTVGDYKWTTYGEAATAWAAIGSGLVAHGIPKACHAYSPDAVKFIVNHSYAQAIFCVPQTLHSVVGGVDELMPLLPSATGVKGTSNHYPFCPPKPDDVATMCYTSGTTRTPKVCHLYFMVNTNTIKNQYTNLFFTKNFQNLFLMLSLLERIYMNKITKLMFVY
ncbi:putative long-chain-fatty-acid--CoA ligase [Helianthus anomalus]